MLRGRERHAGAKVDVGQPLQQICRAAPLDTRPAVHHQVLAQSELVVALRLYRQHHAWVALDVA